MKSVSFKIFYFFIFCSFLLSCASEVTEVENPHSSGEYSYMATIQNFDQNYTRANRTTSGDHWTLSSFKNGDLSGFYSLHGNVDSEDGDGPFHNIPMTYAGNYFYNFDIDYNTDTFVKNTTFYYYPWHNNIDYDPAHTALQDEYDDYGLELRQTDTDGIDKCLDFLWIYSASNATGTQNYNHAFASIVFLKDEGFDEVKDNPEIDPTVWVYLEKGASHVTVTNTPASDSYLKNVELVYLKGYRLSEEKCKKWQSWAGDAYTVKNDDPSVFKGKTYEDAFYVLLPTVRGSSRLRVNKIELYDNNGDLRTITDFDLYTGSDGNKKLRPGDRYPLVIRLKDKEPEVVPVSINPWDDKEIIEENKAAGINDYNDFKEWILHYKNYMSTGNYSEELLRFGDRILDTQGNIISWKFYLNNNLDLSSLNEEENEYRIDEFKDCLIGNNHTLSGLPYNFIKILGENGKIQYLNFQGLKNISESTENIGGLFEEFKGTLQNCKIDGFVSGQGKAGLIAGKAEGGEVSSCTFNGVVSGSSTSGDGLFGEMNGDTELSQNNAAGLIFQSIN